MENNSDEQFIIIKSAIEVNKQEIKSNKQDSDEKMMQSTETLKLLTAFMMDQTNISKYSPT